MLDNGDVTSWYDGTVEANGIRQHYWRTGDGSQPAIVLCHGVTDNGLCWTPVARALENDYDVIMVDARGHGLSDAPEDGYGTEDRADDVAALVRALEADGISVLASVDVRQVADEAAENIGRRPYIKQVNNFTLVYDTPPNKMERAIEILHEILDGHEGQDPEKPPRVYFNSFNDWALNILVIVWYHPGDYFAFQEWNHKTNLEILRRFNEEGLEFAFPTNTTYLAYDPNRRLSVNVEKGGSR